jgi:hypothetical protein
MIDMIHQLARRIAFEIAENPIGDIPHGFLESIFNFLFLSLLQTGDSD